MQTKAHAPMVARAPRKHVQQCGCTCTWSHAEQCVRAHGHARTAGCVRSHSRVHKHMLTSERTWQHVATHALTWSCTCSKTRAAKACSGLGVHSSGYACDHWCICDLGHVQPLVRASLQCYLASYSACVGASARERGSILSAQLS